MPTPEPFHDIAREQRVIHARYARGFVKRIDRLAGVASVQFDNDGDVPRTVRLRHLTPLPADMPAGIDDPLSFARTPFRMVWPLDRAGEPVAAATARQ